MSTLLQKVSLYSKLTTPGSWCYLAQNHIKVLHSAFTPLQQLSLKILYSPKMSTKMLNYLSNKMWANSSFIVRFIKLWACFLLGKNIKVCFKDTITLTSSCIMVYSFKNLTCSSLPPQRLSAINQGRKYPASQLPWKMSGLQRAGLGEWDSKPTEDLLLKSTSGLCIPLSTPPQADQRKRTETQVQRLL